MLTVTVMATVQVTADIDFSKRHCGSNHTRHALDSTTINLLSSTFLLSICLFLTFTNLHLHIHMYVFYLHARKSQQICVIISYFPLPSFTVNFPPVCGCLLFCLCCISTYQFLCVLLTSAFNFS